MDGQRAANEEISPDIFSEYKKTAYKVGVFTAIMCFMRIPAGLLIKLFRVLFEGSLPDDAMYVGHLLLSLLFLQVLPSVIGGAMFGFFGKNSRLKQLYMKPKGFTKAVGNFPAVYGMGQIVNIITIVITILVTSESDLNENLNPVTSLTAPSMGTAWFLLVFAAVLAPVFEEFVFRGVLLQALKPYGNGIAILYSGVLFGLFHGNLSQCFYTMIMGIALGYIADVTDSLLPTTVMHALLNSVAGFILLFLSTPSVQDYLLSGSREEIPDGDMAVIVVFAIFTISALLLAFIGMILAVVKLKKIRRYRVPKVCAEISAGQKAKTLLLSVPAIIAALLLLDTYLGLSDGLISKLFG